MCRHCRLCESRRCVPSATCVCVYCTLECADLKVPAPPLTAVCRAATQTLPALPPHSVRHGALPPPLRRFCGVSLHCAPLQTLPHTVCRRTQRHSAADGDGDAVRRLAPHLCPYTTPWLGSALCSPVFQLCLHVCVSRRRVVVWLRFSVFWFLLFLLCVMCVCVCVFVWCSHVFPASVLCRLAVMWASTPQSARPNTASRRSRAGPCCCLWSRGRLLCSVV